MFDYLLQFGLPGFGSNEIIDFSLIFPHVIKQPPPPLSPLVCVINLENFLNSNSIQSILFSSFYNKVHNGYKSNLVYHQHTMKEIQERERRNSALYQKEIHSHFFFTNFPCGCNFWTLKNSKSLNQILQLTTG